jgi:integrase
MRQSLTPAFVRDVEFAHDGRKKVDRVIYWDQHKDGVSGFGLMVTSKHKSYVFQYYKDRRYRRMTIGDANDLNLSDARKIAKRMVGEVANGHNPLVERRAAEAAARAAAEAQRRKVEAAQTTTLKAVAENYLTRECGLKRDAEGNATFEGGNIKSGDQRLGVFERHVYPTLGSRQIGEITRYDIAGLLDEIQDKSGPRMADVTLAYLSKLFNWYASRAPNFRNPIVRDMKRTKPKERARKRVLTDQEIRDVWAGLDAGCKTDEIPSCFARLVRTLLLTGLRRTEAARASWPELGYLRRDDFEGEVLTIPGARMKGKLDHAVPLTPIVLTPIGNRPNDVKARPFIFSTTGGGKPFSGYGKAKAALDEQIAKLRKKDSRDPMPRWVLHDLRRTAKTLMQRAGVQPYISERVLAHVIRGIEGTYDVWDYLPQKRDALVRLGALVERILKTIEW